MMQFQGFKPEAQKRIASKLGYTGDMSNFDGYLEQNPEAKQQMDTYNQQAVKMMQGGMVRKNYQEGGTVPQIKQDTIDRMATGAVPAGAEVKGVGVATDALKDTFISTSQQNQGIKDSSGKAVSGTITQQQQLTPGQVAERRREDGQQTAEVVEGVRGTAPTVAKASDTDTDATDANLIATEDLRMAQDDVKEDVLDKQKSATLTTTTESDSMITAEESEKDVEGNVKTSVSNLDAAQGTAVKVDSPAARQIQDGEIIDGVADAQKAAKFTEQIQAAEATPSKQATVKGQLESLMQDFEGGETPPWAAGAMRNVSAQMAARGLGASSMAGQALVQAAMESSLPIAMADAQTVAGFEMANLSNRQQRSMLAAEQRAAFMGQEFDQDFQARVLVASKITDIANMNFTAEQQIALENSRAANTMELANTSNKQALVMGEAAALSNLDMANLNNRQQAAVQNAQTFLSTDMANLSNEQQVELFKGQTRSQSLFSDQAAENAALQFNATSENQTDQFFSNLKVQNNQFNTAQDNAMKQFNAGDESAMSKFNAEVANQRDQFNATNQLVVAQANAGWRREIATAETATINRVNEINASNVLATSNQGYANLWQEHGDLMEWAWTSAEGERDRQNAVTLSHLAAGRERTQAEYEADLASSAAIGDFVGKLLLGSFGF